MTNSSKSKSKKLIGKVICPKCGHKQPMEIPKISCQAFYKCEKCNNIISAEKSCCVFCDYGDRNCPFGKNHQK